MSDQSFGTDDRELSLRPFRGLPAERGLINHCVVAGANGGFGRLFSRLLLEAHVEVVGLDLAPESAIPDVCSRYLAADLTRPSDKALAEVGRSDCLLLCLPENAISRALGRIIDVLPQGALLVDTTSVKMPHARAIAGCPVVCEVLSLNPMFSPEVGFAGQDVAAVGLRPGPRSSLFETWIKGWGAHIVHLSAEEHDRQAAMTQVAAHAAILAYGLALAQLGYDSAGAITTPPQRALLGLVARITARDPDLYWHIQCDNPFACEARRAVMQALDRIDQLTSTGAREAFRDALAAAATLSHSSRAF